MIEEVFGCIDYDECGAGPAIVLVPGSCSTGAAWRPIISDLSSRFRCVTTSLLGYGGTVERRTASDPSISHEAEVLESVIRKAGGPIHLVGHSFGGLVALVVALHNQVPLSSLVILEAPATELLRAEGENRHYNLFRDMTKAYFASFASGNVGAIAAMIRFLRWPRHLCLLAAASSRLRRADDARQYRRLVKRVRLSAIGGIAGRDPDPCHSRPGKCKSSSDAVRQRDPERMYRPGRAGDD
jgi:pimeloyl-ACP methyl ester carboxylesterase